MEDFHHASKRAVCPITCAPSTSARASIQARVPRHLAQQPHAGDRRSDGPTASRSRCSNRARSCSISPTRQIASAARPARARRRQRAAVLANGRAWADVRPGQSLPHLRRPRRWVRRSTAAPTTVNRLFGVMNTRPGESTNISPAPTRSPTDELWARETRSLPKSPVRAKALGACKQRKRRAYVRALRRRGREAEGGGLLNRYRVVKPYRGFESLRLRQRPQVIS